MMNPRTVEYTNPPKNDEIHHDYEDDCPCNTCELDCDYWDANYCCTLCRWKNGGEEPSWCDDCDPWDI